MQPKSLTDNQRDLLLTELRETAPDMVLVAAIQQSRNYHERAKELEQVPYGRELYKIPPFNKATHTETKEEAPAQPVEERINKSPGKSSINKIGGKTKDWIVSELKEADRTAAHFGTKYSEHLKLLCNRGTIKFDGVLYYLP